MTNSLTKTTTILKNKVQTDVVFREEYERIMYYYLRKFAQDTVLRPTEKEQALQELEFLFNRQFAQGFALIQAYQEENPTLPLLVDKIGFVNVINNVPKEIYELYRENNLDCTYVETSDTYAMDKLTEYGTDYYDKLMLAFKDITYYGIIYACLDAYEELIEKESIHSLTEITLMEYLTPQLFIVPNINNPADVNRTYEIFSYDLPEKPTSWMGRISFAPHDNQQVVDILLSDRIAEYEKAELVQHLCSLLPFEETYLNVMNVSSFQTLQYTKAVPQTEKGV